MIVMIRFLLVVFLMICLIGGIVYTGIKVDLYRDQQVMNQVDALIDKGVDPIEARCVVDTSLKDSSMCARIK